MKSFLRKILFFLGIIGVFPLLIPFILTTEQKIIKADVERWQDCLGWEQRPIIIQLLALLKEAKEFRNLYYLRLFKGNFLGRFWMYLLKTIYRKCPYFFLDSSCNIGPGLFIQHGFSTIIMADMGANCWVNQQVTIGYKDKTGRPQIGDNVRITAGAKVIGNICLGNNITVGANAVVIKNVPDNCVVVGVPAYIIKRDGVKVKEEL
ncbi:serine acetyltransferase [Crocosphaera sp. UHCC 0190]|uniref:serine O-acetyltransferase n=1 Tax=Crocosphaera sp. UHCC 0190 TaxID=3110246 RepID=UPI002B1E9681|nr:serine acetyltransferase [Crocosphaera sp. UHCC 0190]MEA5511195.1 serine acetyltransferase [Crocosphaera sp. UHCC 0190]